MAFADDLLEQAYHLANLESGIDRILRAVSPSNR
jgi:hypothetical protein